MIQEIKEKVCTICKEVKEVNNFYKDSSKKDGFRNHCKACIKARDGLNSIIGIYKITSPSEKIYIGQSRNISKRFRSYRNLTSSVEVQAILYKSLVKYGSGNHTFEIVEECSIEELDCRERHWQDFYDVTGKNGLNCLLQECGNSPRIMSDTTKNLIIESLLGRKHSEETKKKISEGNKGKIISDEVREKISVSIKLFYESNENPNKGRVHTKEAKNKMSEAHIGKILTEEHKSKIGRKGEDSKNFGRNMPEEQKEKLRGERPHCQGENHFQFGKPLSEEHKQKLSDKAIQRYEERPELKEAMRERMSGENHRQRGIPIGEYQKSKIREKVAKLVLNLQTGIFYESAREVSDIFGINYSSLRRWLNTEGKNKSDFIYC